MGGGVQAITTQEQQRHNNMDWRGVVQQNKKMMKI